MRMLLFVVSATVLLAVDDARGQNMAAAHFPRVRELSAPDWVKPGVRLTYYTIGAHTYTDRYVYFKKKGGGWEDKESGRKYGRKEARGSGGHGYTQVDVVAVTPKEVVLSVRSFFLSEMRKKAPSKLTATVGQADIAGAAGGFWIHPKAFRRAAAVQVEGEKDEFAIVRMIHEIDGKKYNAVRIQYGSKGAQQSYVYDEDSGVLLFVAQSATFEGAGDDKNIRTSSGGKTMSQSTFQSFRQLRLPWANAPMPHWLHKVKKMEYEGTAKVTIPGTFPVEMPFAARYEFLERGTNWTTMRLTAVQGRIKDLDPETAGFMESTSLTRMEVCTGPGQIGGAWIPPAGLAGLKVGQVIDRDPITHIVTSVTHVGPLEGRNVVVIREENTKKFMEYHYDMRSGGLLRSRAKDLEFHIDTLVRLKRTE